MPQRKTPPGAPAGVGLERVGPYTLGGLLRRDRLGEVYAGVGEEGEVRLRVCAAASREGPGALGETLDRLAAVSHPAVAPVLDQFVDPSGRVAVVAPADLLSLAERRRRGRLDAATVAPLGCVLLDGLAALHAAGVQHGAVGTALVGIDAEGAARWHDAGVLPAISRARLAPAVREAADVSECAALLRDLGRLPVELEALLDPVAGGMPGAIQQAAPLAEAWRAVLEKLGMPVPPPGVRTRIPGLLPPPPRPSRLAAVGSRVRRLPPWTRPVAAGLLVAAALGVVPAAALGPGGGPLLESPAAYLPARQGMQLTYRLRSGSLDADVVLRVTEAKVVAGDPTAVLDSHTDIQGGAASLPLGLGGATARLVGGDSLVHTASGGAVRDLLAPLFPGRSWQDRRTGVVSTQQVTETRTVLGPVSLSLPGGHFDRCVAVALTSLSRLPGGSSVTGTGTLWYCPGVGLAKALLTASDATLEIDLVSVR